MKSEQLRKSLSTLRTNLLEAIKSEVERFNGAEIMLSEVDYNDVNGCDRLITSYISSDNTVELDYEVSEGIDTITDVHVLFDILSQLESTDND